MEGFRYGAKKCMVAAAVGCRKANFSTAYTTHGIHVLHYKQYQSHYTWYTCIALQTVPVTLHAVYMYCTTHSTSHTTRGSGQVSCKSSASSCSNLEIAGQRFQCLSNSLISIFTCTDHHHLIIRHNLFQYSHALIIII